MSKRSDNRLALGTTGVFAILMCAAMMLAPAAQAGTLRRPGSSFGASGSGGLDTFLSGYYDFGTGSVVDNNIELENPTSTNGSICAMIYIFDTREEMGECCGCPITPNQLLHDSIKHVIGNSWTLAPGAPSHGVIQVVSATENNVTVPPSAHPCLPNQFYSPTPTLDGWVTHAQTISAIASLTEVPLTDNGDADPTEGTFLINLCGAIIGNGSGSGVCNCPMSDE